MVMSTCMPNTVTQGKRGLLNGIQVKSQAAYSNNMFPTVVGNIQKARGEVDSEDGFNASL